jgi:transposase
MTTRKAYPSDVTDEEWAFVAPYLTVMTPDAPQRSHDLREVFNSLRWLVRTGSPWRYLPNDLPPYAAVFQQTQRWVRAGCFEAIVQDLRALLRLAARAGLTFYVCPGTSSWCSFAGRVDNAVANLRAAAKAGMQHGAAGYLIADWGDFGHRQYQSASYIPFLYGAAVSWSLKHNHDVDAPRAVSALAFDDPSGRLGRLWWEAGRLYLETGVKLKNQTALFRVMQADLLAAAEPSANQEDPLEGLTSAALARVVARAKSLRKEAVAFSAAAGEAQLGRRELILTLDVLVHACQRAQTLMDFRAGQPTGMTWRTLAAANKKITHRHRILWLARDRQGGLLDSRAHYDRNLTEYHQIARRALAMQRDKNRPKALGILTPLEVDLPPASRTKRRTAARKK